MKLFMFTLLWLTFHSTGLFAETPSTISTGYLFPELQFTSPTQAADKDYLGLDDQPYFSPSEINAQVVLFEFLNVHCPHCQKQAAVYNQLFDRIEQQPQLRQQIKMIGIAVGNQDKEILKFKQKYHVPFPIIADADFLYWRSIGGRSTPFTVYVRQARTGQKGVVAATHHGYNSQLNETYDRLLEIAGESVDDLLLPTADLEPTTEDIVRPFNDKQLEIKVRTALAKHGTISNFEQLSLKQTVYRALVRRAELQRTLYAAVVSRATVCDICHDVHFIYLFDAQLNLVDLEALQLTKYGNQKWSKRDLKQLRQQLKGRNLSQPFTFDPDVDAITSATITSAIIYDALNAANSLAEELRRKNLLP